LRLASAELVELHSADGQCYRPERDRVELEAADRFCVERLRRHAAAMAARKRRMTAPDVQASG
jgi:hypothetical protein